MTIQEAIQTVQKYPSNLNVYYLEKNGAINIIREVATSSNLMLLYEYDVKVTKNWSLDRPLSPFDVDIDITKPLPFDSRSKLDKKKKVHIYHAYKRQYEAVVNQLVDYGELKNQQFKIWEEATGALLTTTGIVITLFFPPAGGLGLVGGTITGLSSLQALYGWIRALVAYSDYDFLKILDDDEALKKIMQIIDLLGLVYALKGIPKAISKANTFFKFDSRKVGGIIEQLNKLRSELNLVKAAMKNGISHNPFISNVEAETLLMRNIKLLESQWEFELVKINQAKQLFKAISKELPVICNEILDIPTISKFFKGGMGGLVIQFFSLLSNATEGHGVATGTLNEFSKGESILQKNNIYDWAIDHLAGLSD